MDKFFKSNCFIMNLFCFLTWNVFFIILLYNSTIWLDSQILMYVSTYMAEVHRHHCKQLPGRRNSWTNFEGSINMDLLAVAQHSDECRRCKNYRHCPLTIGYSSDIKLLAITWSWKSSFGQQHIGIFSQGGGYRWRFCSPRPVHGTHHPTEIDSCCYIKRKSTNTNWCFEKFVNKVLVPVINNILYIVNYKYKFIMHY